MHNLIKNSFIASGCLSSWLWFTSSGLRQRFVVLIKLGFLHLPDWPLFSQNTPLEEIAKIFDGENARVGGPAGTKSGQVALEQIEIRDKTEAKDL